MLVRILPSQSVVNSGVLFPTQGSGGRQERRMGLAEVSEASLLG